MAWVIFVELDYRCKSLTFWFSIGRNFLYKKEFWSHTLLQKGIRFRWHPIRSLDEHPCWPYNKNLESSMISKYCAPLKKTLTSFLNQKCHLIRIQPKHVFVLRPPDPDAGSMKLVLQQAIYISNISFPCVSIRKNLVLWQTMLLTGWFCLKPLRLGLIYWFPCFTLKRQTLSQNHTHDIKNQQLSCSWQICIYIYIIIYLTRISQYLKTNSKSTWKRNTVMHEKSHYSKDIWTTTRSSIFPASLW